MKKSLLLLSLLFLTSFSLWAQNLRISGSNGHSVIICSNGNVFAWGANNEGQVGVQIDGNTPYPAAHYDAPQRVYGLSEIFQIDAGSGGHTLALTCDGKVNAWGRNDYGQLGDGTVTGFKAKPIYVLKGAEVAALPGIGGSALDQLEGVSYVSGGNDESFAILETGHLAAWGQNDKGQLGNGAVAATQLTPVLVKTDANVPLTNVIMVEAGDENGYALADPDGDGVYTVYSWGDAADNSGLALGRPVANNTYARPVQKEGGGDLTNIISLSAGDRHALAIDADGYLWAWGGDWGHGQVGDGYGNPPNNGGYYTQPFATKVVAGEKATVAANWKTEYLGDRPETKVVSIAAGQAHSAAVLADGSVVTWGSNGFFNCGPGCSTPAGQLGVGNRFTTHASYQDADAANTAPMIAQKCTGGAFTNAVEVSDGDAWTFVLTDDGKIWVAGWNGGGQLGIGNTTNSNCFRELSIPSCGITAPCPVANLGNDFEECYGFTYTLSAGLIYKDFEVRWYKDGVLENTELVTVASKEVTWPTSGFGTYRVEIEDKRQQTDRPCTPCPLAFDEVTISPLAADFNDPRDSPAPRTDSVTYCKFNTQAFVHTTNASGIYAWYPTQTSMTELGRSTGEGKVLIDLTGLTPTGVDANGKDIYTLWVADSTIYTGAVAKPSQICGTAFATGDNLDKYRTNLTVYKDITLKEFTVAVYNAQASYTYPGGVQTLQPQNGTIVVQVLNSVLNNGVLVPGTTELTTFSIPLTVTTVGTYFATAPVNFELPGTSLGTTYFFKIKSATGFSQLQSAVNSCTQTYPLRDDLENGAIARVNATINDGGSADTKYGNIYNFKFEKRAEYICGRIPVLVTEDCPPCEPPTALQIDPRPSIDLCVGDNQTIARVAASTTLGTSQNGGYYYTWLKDGVALNPAALYTSYQDLVLSNVDLTTSGEYKLRIEDGNLNNPSCYLEDSVEVTVYPLPHANITTTGDDLKYCKGESGVTLEAEEQTITGTATYTWYKGTTASGPFAVQAGTGATFTEATAGFWTVVVEVNGCKDSLAVPVEVIEKPLPDAPTATATPDPICEGEDLTLEAEAVTGASPTYRWVGPAGFTAATQNTNRADIELIHAGTYTVFATVEGCEGLGGNVEVTVNPIPATPVAGNDGPDYCLGEDINLSSSAGNPGATYSWTGPGFAAPNTDQNPTLTPATIAMSGEYEVTITENGCTSLPGSTTITVHPIPPTPTITGDNDVCENEAGVTYSVPLTSGSSYLWTVPTGATITAGGVGPDNNMITVTWGAASGNVTVQETSSAGCAGPAGTFGVTVNQNLTVDVAIGPDPLEICAGDGATFTATPTNEGTTPTYVWKINGSAASGATNSASYAPAGGVLQDGDVVTVELTSSEQCTVDETVTSNAIAVQVNTVVAATATLTTPATVCATDPVVINGTFGGTGSAPTYEWYVNNVLDLTNTGATFSSNNLSDGDQVHVVMTSSSSCANPAEATSDAVTVSIDAVPSPANISGPALTCIGNEVFTNDPITIGTGAWSIVSGPGSVAADNATSATVSGLLAGQTTRVRFTVSNGVCPDDFAEADIQRTSDLTTPDAGDDVPVCETATSTVSLTGNQPNLSNNETGTWYAVGPASISQTGNTGTPSGLVVGINKFYYEMSNTAGCSTADTVYVIVDQDVTVAPFSPSSVQTCEDPYQLVAAAPTVGTGTWSVVSGTATIDPSQVNSPTANLDFGADGTVIVEWSVKNGVCPAKAEQLTVVKAGSVTVPQITLDGADITGTTVELCANNTYSFSANGPGNTNETGIWNIVSGTSVNITEDDTRPQTLNSGNLTADGSSTVIEYTITSTIPGCQPATRSVTLNVKDVPAQPGPISGLDPVCADTPDEFYSISPVPGATGYTWSVGAGTSGLTLDPMGSAVLVDFAANATNPSVIQVTADNSCGSSLPQTISVTVNPRVTPTVQIAPTTARICQNDAITFTSTVTFEGSTPGYQWYVNGNPVPVAEGGNTPSFTSSNLLNGDEVHLELYSSEQCQNESVWNSNGAVESNKVIMDVVSLQTVEISTNVDPSSDICEGDPVVFTANPKNEGTVPSYVWTINGNPAPGATNSPIYNEPGNLQDGDVVAVELTSNTECPDANPANDQLIMTVRPNLIVDATITPAVENICHLQDPVPTFTVTGNNHGVNPTYQWTLNGQPAGSGTFTFTPSNLSPSTTYNIGVTVTSSERCVDKTVNPNKQVIATPAVLNVHPQPASQISGPVIYCPNTTVQLQATPDNPNYTYKWYNNGTLLTNSTSQLVTTAGNYTVEITTDNGCVKTSPVHSVSQFNFAAMSISNIAPSKSDFTKCKDDPFTMSVSPAADNYIWKLNGEVVNTGNRVISVVDSGQYWVILEVNSGPNATCKDSISQRINDVPRPAPRIEQLSEVICEGDVYPLTVVDDSAALGSVIWYRNQQPIAGANNSSYNATVSGYYYVNESNGYCNTISDSIYLEVEKYPIANAGPDQYIVQGDQTNLSGYLSQYAYQYAWSSNQYDSTKYIILTADGSNVAVRPDSSKTKFYLTVTSPSGKCQDVDSMIVYVEKLPRPWNSFSPNGDGIYEYWIIENLEDFPDALVEVYNRWGNLVWRTRGYNTPWRGENFRNGEDLPVATYYYIIYPNGGKVDEPLTGHVTIVK